MPTPKNVKYFKTSHHLRRWFEKNHGKRREQWIGFYKKESGIPSITWPESVDQALCFGWIDGIRKSIDDKRYTIRFTPRRASSIWSAVNIKRVKELQQRGAMKNAGLKAFEARDPKKSNRYSFEQRANPKFPPVCVKRFKANVKAWNNFSVMPPGYRRMSTWWVISAKHEATKLKRLDQLIHDSEHHRSIAPLRRLEKKK